MILEKMRYCLWKLEPGFSTYDWTCLLCPSGPNVVSRPQALRSRIFWRFYWIHLMILEKMRSCLWKLEPGFWTYGWYVFWVQVVGLNVVSRPQTLRSRYFLRFCDFIGFISRFLKKWGPACENLSQGSGLMARYSSGPKWPKCSF